MPEEPECTCEQTDVDRFDASGCELHNPKSEWNRARRFESKDDQFFVDMGCEDYDEVPF